MGRVDAAMRPALDRPRSPAGLARRRGDPPHASGVRHHRPPGVARRARGNERRYPGERLGRNVRTGGGEPRSPHCSNSPQARGRRAHRNHSHREAGRIRMGASIEARLRARVFWVIAPALVLVGATAVTVTAYVLDRTDRAAARGRAESALRTLRVELSEGDAPDLARRETLAAGE